MTLLLTALVVAAISSAAPSETRKIRPEAPDEAPPPEPATDPHVLTESVLCARAAHYLEDGDSASLLKARDILEGIARERPEAWCGRAGLARALAALTQRAIVQEDPMRGRALEEALTAVRLAADEPDAAAAHSAALLANLRIEEAEAEAERAMALDPGSIGALQAAATARLATGRLADARSAAERGLTLRPDLPIFHHLRANVDFLESNHGMALAGYKRAILLCPDFSPSRLQIASTYEQMGRFREAAEVFREIIDRDPKEAGLVNLFMAQALIRRGSLEPAVEILGKSSFANARGMGAGTVRYLEGVAYEKLSRRAQATAAFREVVDRYPDATLGPSSGDRLADRAFEALARLKLQDGRADEASAIMEQGVSRPEAGPDLLLRLAHLYDDYSLPQKALPLLERACSGAMTARGAAARMSGCVGWARSARRLDDLQGLDRLVTALAGHQDALDRIDDVVHDLAGMRALAIAGRSGDSLQWLRRAMGRGYAHLAWIEDDPELELLRRAPGYAALVASATPR